MNHAKHMRFFLAFALLVVSLPVCVLAQSSSGSISGIVSDEQGGALPGVTISATNVATSATRTTVSNETGHYQIALLPPGTYDVAFDDIECAPFVKPSISIRSGATTDLGTLTATRSRILRGRVVDATGAPVSDAQIAICSGRPAGARSPAWRCSAPPQPSTIPATNTSDARHTTPSSCHARRANEPTGRARCPAADCVRRGGPGGASARRHRPCAKPRSV